MQLTGNYTEFTYFSNTIILHFFQVKKVSHADGSKRRKDFKKHNFGYNIGFIRLIFVK